MFECYCLYSGQCAELCLASSQGWGVGGGGTSTERMNIIGLNIPTGTEEAEQLIIYERDRELKSNKDLSRNSSYTCLVARARLEYATLRLKVRHPRLISLA